MGRVRACLISGAIAHVITTEPPEQRTLAKVRDLLTDPLFMGSKKQIVEGVSVVGEMVRNGEAAGLASRAASQLTAAGDQERGSILSTALRHTKWLDSPPMRNVLSGAGFDLRDLKREPTTVYVVIPPEELDNHKRFLRLFVALGIAAMTRAQARPKNRVLFIVDEFPALGRLEAVRVGINVIRSYGVILWPIIQNIGQLVHLYGKDAQIFLDAAGAVQVFSIGGQDTAAFVAENLGERLVDRKTQGQVVTALARLRTAGETQEQTDRAGLGIADYPARREAALPAPARHVRSGIPQGRIHTGPGSSRTGLDRKAPLAARRAAPSRRCGWGGRFVTARVEHIKEKVDFRIYALGRWIGLHLNIPQNTVDPVARAVARIVADAEGLEETEAAVAVEEIAREALALHEVLTDIAVNDLPAPLRSSGDWIGEEAAELRPSPSMTALDYPPEAHGLAKNLMAAIAAWEAGPGADITSTDRDLHIA